MAWQAGMRERETQRQGKLATLRKNEKPTERDACSSEPAGQEGACSVMVSGMSIYMKRTTWHIKEKFILHRNSKMNMEYLYRRYFIIVDKAYFSWTNGGKGI